MHLQHAHHGVVQPAATDGDRMRALEVVVAGLASSAAVERMAAVISEAAASALVASLVVVALLDDDRRLRPVHAVGIDPGVLRRVLMDRELVKGTGGQPKGDVLLAQRIAVGVRALGMIVLGRASDRPFSEHDRAFLDVLGGLFALALDRRRLTPRRFRVGASLHGPARTTRRVGTLVQAAGLSIDLGRQEVAIEGRIVRLTPSELRLLVFLAEEPGRPRSRREILQHLSGGDDIGQERACDVHISNLRRKIEKDPSRPEWLATLRGVGYALTGVETLQLSAGASRA
jgi:DNA-binding winged helix-turn-helix (wHTH) protein